MDDNEKLAKLLGIKPMFYLECGTCGEDVILDDDKTEFKCTTDFFCTDCNSLCNSYGYDNSRPITPEESLFGLKHLILQRYPDFAKPENTLKLLQCLLKVDDIGFYSKNGVLTTDLVFDNPIVAENLTELIVLTAIDVFDSSYIDETSRTVAQEVEWSY